MNLGEIVGALFILLFLIGGVYFIVTKLSKNSRSETAPKTPPETAPKKESETAGNLSGFIDEFMPDDSFEMLPESIYESDLTEVIDPNTQFEIMDATTLNAHYGKNDEIRPEKMIINNQSDKDAAYYDTHYGNNDEINPKIKSEKIAQKLQQQKINNQSDKDAAYYDTLYGKNASEVIRCSNAYTDKYDILECLESTSNDNWHCKTQGLFDIPSCYYACDNGVEYDECIRMSHYMYPDLRKANEIPIFYDAMR
jgi:hypothetical protein